MSDFVHSRIVEWQMLCSMFGCRVAMLRPVSHHTDVILGMCLPERYGFLTANGDDGGSIGVNEG